MADVLHEAIVSVLKNAAGVSAITTKIRPVQVESFDDVPFIQYEIDNGTEEYAANGYAGVSHASFTIRTFATSYAGVAALDAAVRAAMLAVVGTTVVTDNGSTLLRRLQSQSMLDIPTVGKLGRSKAVRGRMRTFSITYKPQ